MVPRPQMCRVAMSLVAAPAELSAAALLLLFLLGAATACSQQFLCLRPLPQGQGLFLQHGKVSAMSGERTQIIA